MKPKERLSMSDVASIPVHKKLRGGGYDAIHYWLRKHYGKADRCEAASCSKTSTVYHWAKLKDCAYEHKRENFMRMCASCHRKYDLTDEMVAKMAKTLISNRDSEHCKNGHQRTDRNTLWGIGKSGNRIIVSCKECRNVSQRKYRNASR